MNVPTEQQRRATGRGWQPLLAPLLDGVLSAACYLLAYRVRFAAAPFRDFLPHAVNVLPLVVGSQLGAFAALGVYRAVTTRGQLRRLLVASIVGTAVAAILIFEFHGPTGISRSAFSADLLLFGVVTAGWRAARVLWRQRRTDSSIPSDMIDRATERITLGDTLTSLVRYRELIKNLVLKDLKLKYRGSVLGFMWSLVNPLVMIGVYTIAFTYIMRNSVPAFVFFLMLGTLAWTFFASSASMSTGAIIDSGSLMKSVTFPRAILPIATVLFNLVQYALTILVFLPVMLIIYRVPLSGPMLVYPVFLTLQVLFTIGVALILAAATAFFRDVRHLLEIALSILFWMTPIIYPLSQVNEKARLLLLLSPLSSFIVAYQQIFYFRRWPELTLWVIALTYALGTLLVGVWLFLSVEDQFAEQI
jgi:ABC-2 type transport system permease protein